MYAIAPCAQRSVAVMATSPFGASSTMGIPLNPVTASGDMKSGAAIQIENEERQRWDHYHALQSAKMCAKTKCTSNKFGSIQISFDQIPAVPNQ
jgi:hypothetical protein